MNAKVPDAVYSKIAMDCSAALLRVIDPAAIAKVGWGQFLEDVFDYTDGFVVELERRLAGRQSPGDAS